MSAIFETYNRLNLVAMSIVLSAVSTDKGYKKKPVFPSNWQKTEQSKFDTTQIARSSAS